MVFHSLQYLFFLPAAFALFLLTPQKFRWLALLGSSVVFFAFRHPYGIVLLPLVLVSGITFISAIRIANCASDGGKKALYWGGVGVNLLVLLCMKYAPALLFPGSGNLLFVGVSYYTLQAISYLTDVYAGIQAPEPHPGYLSLHLAFFPKLLQGPLERSEDLLPQLREPYVFDYENLRTGVVLFAWGMFKKVVVADRLAVFVDRIFGHVHGNDGLAFLIATYMYAIQLYCDFSGYTDMALGSARLFNIRLTQNFRNPYFAISIADFWRRWHISLSRWLFAYIFNPLQMLFRDWGRWGTASALLLTFLVSGAWHGIGWGFVAWGMLHGLYLGISFLRTPVKKASPVAVSWKAEAIRVGKIVATFHLVCFSWIFFRANTLGDALFVVGNMFSGIRAEQFTGTYFRYLKDQAGFKSEHVVLALFVLIADYLIGQEEPFRFLFQKNIFVRWTFYLLLVLSIMFFGIYDNMSFIYLRF